MKVFKHNEEKQKVLWGQELGKDRVSVLEMGHKFASEHFSN